MISVDGVAITPGPDANDAGQDEDEALRTILLELRQCTALVVLDPPPELRTALGGYALDIADELDKRAGRGTQLPSPPVPRDSHWRV